MKGGRYFKNHKLANAFIRSFKKAGAYYTLKNYIMFDRRFILHWFDEVYTRENALRKLRLEIQAPDYYFYKALKVSMAETTSASAILLRIWNKKITANSQSVNLYIIRISQV